MFIWAFLPLRLLFCFFPVLFVVTECFLPWKVRTVGPRAVGSFALSGTCKKVSEPPCLLVQAWALEIRQLWFKFWLCYIFAVAPGAGHSAALGCCLLNPFVPYFHAYNRGMVIPLALRKCCECGPRQST